MGGGNDDTSFPYFEGTNFSGWLKQFKAVLREFDCDEIIETVEYLLGAETCEKLLTSGSDVNPVYLVFGKFLTSNQFPTNVL